MEVSAAQERQEIIDEQDSSKSSSKFIDESKFRDDLLYKNLNGKFVLKMDLPAVIVGNTAITRRSTPRLRGGPATLQLRNASHKIASESSAFVGSGQLLGPL